MSWFAKLAPSQQITRTSYITLWGPTRGYNQAIIRSVYALHTLNLAELSRTAQEYFRSREDTEYRSLHNPCNAD